MRAQRLSSTNRWYARAEHANHQGTRKIRSRLGLRILLRLTGSYACLRYQTASSRNSCTVQKNGEPLNGSPFFGRIGGEVYQRRRTAYFLQKSLCAYCLRPLGRLAVFLKSRLQNRRSIWYNRDIPGRRAPHRPERRRNAAVPEQRGRAHTLDKGDVRKWIGTQRQASASGEST